MSCRQLVAAGLRPARRRTGHLPTAGGGIAARFAQDVSGAGFDLPTWLEALQQEVDRVESDAADDEELPGPELPVPQIDLSREEVRRQIKAIGGQ